MLQIDAVPTGTMDVLKFLFDQPVLGSRFFLVGGTGLALHLGHRIYADNDPILLKEKNLTWSTVKRTIIAETKKLL